VLVGKAGASVVVGGADAMTGGEVGATVASGDVGAVVGIVARLHAANPDNARSKMIKMATWVFGSLTLRMLSFHLITPDVIR
jgi:hypothetical protein